MTFRSWSSWFRSVPWVLRWFLVLILIRPGLDTLYYVKDVSPMLSPLNIVGVLTPILIVVALFSKQVPPIRKVFADQVFFAWGTLIGFNVVAVLTVGLSFQAIEVAVKLFSPFLIFLLARRLIRSKRDLVGVLTTFLYSTAFPFGMLFYEKLVGPVGGSLTLTRGFYRSSGLYADVMSYAIYLVGAFLIAGFLFLQEEGKSTLTRRTLRLAVVSSLSLVGLLHIHHTASYVVAFAIAGLLVYHVLGRRGAGAGAVMVSGFSLATIKLWLLSFIRKTRYIVFSGTIQGVGERELFVENDHKKSACFAVPRKGAYDHWLQILASRRS